MADRAVSEEERSGPGLVGEVLAVLPRLVRRTRSQAELVAGLVAQLPCVSGRFASPERSDDGDDDETEGSVPATLRERVDVLTVLGRDRGPTPAEEPGSATERPAEDGGTGAAEVPAESDLAVPDYDSLAASQVVPRLATLSVGELEAVALYERAHRHRQTILNRVAQLLAG